jgi:hypothetical protein
MQIENPNKYLIYCQGCGWKQWASGSQESFANLKEVKVCANCGGSRSFRCPSCGYVAKAKRYVEPPDPKTHVFKKD